MRPQVGEHCVKDTKEEEDVILQFRTVDVYKETIFIEVCCYKDNTVLLVLIEQVTIMH